MNSKVITEKRLAESKTVVQNRDQGKKKKTPKFISLETLKMLWIIMGKRVKIALGGRGDGLVFQCVSRVVAFKIKMFYA